MLQAAAKNIQLKITNSVDDAQVLCDYNMILTILRNLTSNAIKFSHPNTTIKIDIIDFPMDNNYIQVSVKDSGVGIEEESVWKLFRIDEKVTSTTGTNNEGGTGLGLILCKEFIDKHSCKIWVESVLGEGTTFFFTLKKANHQ